MPSRLLTLILVFATSASSALASVSYRCVRTGEVHAVRCCPAASDKHVESADVDSGRSAISSLCCEASSAESALVHRSAPGERLLPLPDAAVVPSFAMHTPGDVPAMAKLRAFDRLRAQDPPGTPLFISFRTLLI